MNFNRIQLIWIGAIVLLVYAVYLIGGNQKKEGESSRFTQDERTTLKLEKKPIEAEWQDVPIKGIKPSQARTIDNKKKQVNSGLNHKNQNLNRRIVSSLSHKEANKEFGKDKISTFIAQAKPEEINFYLSQYFSDDVLAGISDKRRFSDRLFQEYTKVKSNDENRLHGDIYYSLQASFPEQAQSSFNVTGKQKMYAHLRLNGSIENSRAIFIRWLRLDNNKVLLFERKPINVNSNDNWVSLTPRDNWQTGAYLVTYYSFNSTLSIIAQSTYNIDHVRN